MTMNKKGITLVELVVVMLIIAVAAAFIAPNIGAWIPNYRLRSAMREVVSVLRTAQMKAVTTNLEYRVYFDVNGRQFWLEKGNLSSNPTNWVGRSGSNAAREGDHHTIPQGITINVTSNFVEFNTDSSCTGASITLANSKRSFEITTTTTTGKVNWREK